MIIKIMRSAVLVCLALTTHAQNLSTEEQKWYELIMKYRATYKLPKIPLSRSLTFVAQTHVNDMAGQPQIEEPCNLHSWSARGNWQPCCYTDDHAQAACMWNKPRELTRYQGNGYEIALSGDTEAAWALEGWKESRGHNEVIINRGIWKDVKWKAIGIGMKDGFAVVWFGEEKD